MTRDKRFPLVAGLATLGLLDSLYLFLFQTGGVKTLVCPVFGEGCRQVVGSSLARPGGIPDAIFGVIGYAVEALLAIAIPRTQGGLRIVLASFLIIGSVTALALSVFLVHAQKTQTHAWCFWCLVSATLSLIIAFLAVPAARRTIRETLDRCIPRERE